MALPTALTMAAVPIIPTEIVLLTNMFDHTAEVLSPSAESLHLPAMADLIPALTFMQRDENFESDIREDVEDECSKFGVVKMVHVDL